MRGAAYIPEGDDIFKYHETIFEQKITTNTSYEMSQLFSTEIFCSKFIYVCCHSIRNLHPLKVGPPLPLPLSFESENSRKFRIKNRPF